MNYFWAKGILRNYEEVGNVIEAFFKNFNPENMLTINDGQVEMTVFFEEPPMDALKAISYCKFVKFRYGEKLKDEEKETNVEINIEAAEIDEVDEANEADKADEVDEANEADEVDEANEANEANEADEADEADETDEIDEADEASETVGNDDVNGTNEQDNVIPVQIISTAVEENQDTSEESDETDCKQPITETVTETQDVHKNSSRSRSTRASHSKEILPIPEIDNIAKKCASFEQFANSVSKWLGFKGERHTFFVNVIFAAAQAEKIAWTHIEPILRNKSIHETSHRLMCTQQVAKKFKCSENPVTILVLLRTVTSYKTFEFKVTEDVKSEENQSKPLMLCMPIIPEFEQVLQTIDKTKPIKERLKYILSAMGWQDDPENKEHQLILKIADTAVRAKDIDLQDIFIKSRISMEFSNESRMAFSDLLNNFVKKYYPNKKVKLSEFLNDLQKVVVLESEIEN